MKQAEKQLADYEIISSSNLRKQISELANRVAFKKTRVIVSFNSKPKCVILPLEDLEDLEDNKLIDEALKRRKEKGTLSFDELIKKLK